MNRKNLWILLGSALICFSLSGCYTQLGYRDADPYGSGYDSGYDSGYEYGYSDAMDWFDGYYALAPVRWDPIRTRDWWYCDYQQPYWRDHSHPYHYDHDYESYDDAQIRHGWTRNSHGSVGTPYSGRGGVITGGGSSSQTSEPESTTQTRNPARKKSTSTEKADAPTKTEKSTKSEKSKKRKGWGR